MYTLWIALFYQNLFEKIYLKIGRFFQINYFSLMRSLVLYFYANLIVSIIIFLWIQEISSGIVLIVIMFLDIFYFKSYYSLLFYEKEMNNKESEILYNNIIDFFEQKNTDFNKNIILLKIFLIFFFFISFITLIQNCNTLYFISFLFNFSFLVKDTSYDMAKNKYDNFIYNKK